MSLTKKVNSSEREESIGRKVFNKLFIAGIYIGLSLFPACILSSCSNSSDNKGDATTQSDSYDGSQDSYNIPESLYTGQEARERQSYTPDDAGILAELQRDDCPLWSDDDLEVNKYDGMVASYSNKIMMQPPFYTMSMPLEFDSVEVPSMTGYSSFSRMPIRYEFEDFDNYFILDDYKTLIGVASLNKSNELIAEASIDYSEEETSMLEFHYNARGKLIFSCMSIIDPSTGFKQREKDTIGEKERDYFFIVPQRM